MWVGSSEKGFTLVEMLLTIALFAMLMSILVVGLRAGVKTWQNVRKHQAALAERGAALDIMARDVRCAAKMDKNTPAFVEKSEDAVGEVLAITTLESREKQRAGRGAVWSQANYFLRASDDGVEELVRGETLFVTTGALEGQSTETPLLARVSGLRFDYLSKSGEIAETWNEDGLPVAVIVSLTLADGVEMQRTLPVSCGSIAP